MSNSPIRVLLVDDDENLLNAMRRMFRKQIDLHVATGAIEGLRQMEKNGPFSVLISDQNMPKVDGATFLAKVRTHFPKTVRIMLTGNNDQLTAIRAVNDGQVFRFLNKPCQSEALLEAIKDAHAHYMRESHERVVLEETVSGSIKLLTDMLSMAYPETFKRTRLVQKWIKAACPALNIPLTWELKVAASLWPVGDIMLPRELAAKRDAGKELSEAERKALMDTGLTASEMLGNIPRLSGVAKLMLMSTPEGLKLLEMKTPGADARLLLILVDIARATDLSAPKELDAAFARLKESGYEYDVGYLSALPAILARANAEEKSVSLRELSACHLEEGDLLVADLYDDTGRLLLVSGQAVSGTMATALRRLHANGSLSSRVKVKRDRQAIAA